MVKKIIIGEREKLCGFIAEYISSLMETKDIILGGATGRTQFGVYNALRESSADFSRTRIFFLDEYLGDETYKKYAHRELIEKFQDKEKAFRKENIWVPKGFYSHSGKVLTQDDFEKELQKNSEDFIWKGPELNIREDCNSKTLKNLKKELERQEKEIPQIDVQILGLGVEGHIAFNEVGTCDLCGLHITKLSESTIKQNMEDFHGEPNRYAVTQGLRNIMQSRELFLIVFGDHKADALDIMFFGSCPASVLKWHPNITILTDTGAAAKLDRKVLEDAGWKITEL